MAVFSTAAAVDLVVIWLFVEMLVVLVQVFITGDINSYSHLFALHVYTGYPNKYPHTPAKETPLEEVYQSSAIHLKHYHICLLYYVIHL